MTKNNKTIFNTTEKSNFILNMTEEKYSAIAAKALTAMCLMVSLFTIPAELSKDTGYSIAAAGLAISGVVCMILALIAIIKKYVSRKMLLPVSIFGAMLVWGTFSLCNSYNVATSFYGFTGRGEGLLALVFYFGFFITGLTIKKEKALGTFINGIIAAGFLNSVWGLFQIFIRDIPSNYRHVVGINKDIDAASGLAQSPIFLAMLLSLSLSAAIIGFILSKNKTKRIVCIISAALFSFVMMFTYSLAGICGLILAVIAAVAAVCISKAPKSNLISVAAVILPAALAVVLAATGTVGDNNKYKLYDGSIMWQDSFNRLSASGRFSTDLDFENTAEVYSFFNRKTLGIIKDYPILGTGPEQLVYPQLYSSSKIEENFGTFDKNYNEYLYTAATRGIPSMIALIAVLAILIAASAKDIKGGKSKTPEFVTLFLLLLCGTALFFVGCSNITFSPVFWAAAGASCAEMKIVSIGSGIKKNKKSKK